MNEDQAKTIADTLGSQAWWLGGSYGLFFSGRVTVKSGCGI